jgi:hypothetical protein
MWFQNFNPMWGHLGMNQNDWTRKNGGQMDGFNNLAPMTRFDMWKSSAKGCPNDLTTCDDASHSSSKWPCISRSNASSGAGATSTPVRTPNLPRLTAALPQGEQMLAISMKKM